MESQLAGLKLLQLQSFVKILDGKTEKDRELSREHSRATARNLTCRDELATITPYFFFFIVLLFDICFFLYLIETFFGAGKQSNNQSR
jgi:hypothetical protein